MVASHRRLDVVVDDRAGGTARNLPVPKGFNDSELQFLMENAVLPIGRAFQPQALVVTCGADGLEGDPLSKLAMSNTGLWSAVENLLELTKKSVILGGGGYNPWTVIRCWGGLWGRLSGRRIPDELPDEARVFLQHLECDLIDEDDVPESWLTRLADEPNRGPVRPEVKRLPELVLN